MCAYHFSEASRGIFSECGRQLTSEQEGYKHGALSENSAMFVPLIWVLVRQVKLDASYRVQVPVR